MIRQKPSLVLLNKQVCYIHLKFLHKHSADSVKITMALLNNVDTDQQASVKPVDLYTHCFQKLQFLELACKCACIGSPSVSSSYCTDSNASGLEMIMKDVYFCSFFSCWETTKHLSIFRLKMIIYNYLQVNTRKN